MELNQFIELPNDFVDLISMSTSTHVCSSRTSSISERSAESATILCLICGEMLCSQPFCCQKQIFKKRVGCCTAHTHNCCGTSGVFLRVAECQVLLLHLNMSGEEFQIRGCFVPAPYLDDYGETDQGLRYRILFKKIVWQNFYHQKNEKNRFFITHKKFKNR